MSAETHETGPDPKADLGDNSPDASDEPTEAPQIDEVEAGNLPETDGVDPTEESPDTTEPEPPEDPEPLDQEPALAVATPEVDAESQMRRISRRSFVFGAAAVAATAGGFEWLLNTRTIDSIPWPLRRVLHLNEKVALSYFNPNRLMPLLPVSRVTLPARANGDLGLGDDFDVSKWTLQVQPTKAIDSAPDDYDEFTLADIKKLPRHEMVTEFHCIEGWTMVQRWAGARFSDFVEQMTRYEHPSSVPKFVGFETPDGGYYVGLDRPSAMHPQTLLCYEMNGAPLEPAHGAPLRLIIPVKYGVKNLKRIGLITFTDTRPADYWAEQGYDWYAGF